MGTVWAERGRRRERGKCGGETFGCLQTGDHVMGKSLQKEEAETHRVMVFGVQREWQVSFVERMTLWQ